ncbi:MAG: PEP-CTERM sorting domain-containing protein [Cyanobacterium sp. T60_A2020_053]|nr:PEP-CTERM sorting domain-containing protein [Cyanobacterium sp. T60_A2020_053]
MAFFRASKSVVLGLTVTVTGAFVGVSSAQAASLFEFSYVDTASNQSWSGRLTGTPIDSDRIDVSSFFNVVYDNDTTTAGVFAGPSDDLINLVALTELFDHGFDENNPFGTTAGAETLGTPILSFSGDNMNFAACPDTTGCYFPSMMTTPPADGLLFNTLASLSFLSDNRFIAGDSFSDQNPGEIFAFDASNWTLTQIPEPSAVVGLATIGLLGFATRKRKK